jgi:hypothetical protein
MLPLRGTKKAWTSVCTDDRLLPLHLGKVSVLRVQSVFSAN